MQSFTPYPDLFRELRQEVHARCSTRDRSMLALTCWTDYDMASHTDGTDFLPRFVLLPNKYRVLSPFLPPDARCLAILLEQTREGRAKFVKWFVKRIAHILVNIWTPFWNALDRPAHPNVPGQALALRAVSKLEDEILRLFLINYSMGRLALSDLSDTNKALICSALRGKTREEQTHKEYKRVLNKCAGM